MAEGTLQWGLVGAGRMGANLARRMIAGGQDCLVLDEDPDVLTLLAAEGIPTATQLADLVHRLARPRVVWLMVPAGAVGDLVTSLTELLEPDDVVVDGGNTDWREDVARAAALAERGIHHVDVGTSGGLAGLSRGYCLMVGGEPEVVARLEPVFDYLAPGFDAAPRTPGRQGPPTGAERGYLHVGGHGAGHFVKMVHNGIEYGLMASYAEGFGLLAAAAADPGCDYDFDIAEIAEVWRRGSVLGSWLLDLTAGELVADPDLTAVRGVVGDSGEGRWTVQTAVDLGVPVPVLATALFARFASRGGDDVANRVLSVMRQAFGGHLEPMDDPAVDARTRPVRTPGALAVDQAGGGPA